MLLLQPTLRPARPRLVLLFNMSTLAKTIRTACLLEATAAKPGNVHPAAAFVDMTYADLVRSADAVAEILADANTMRVGPAILEAVRATTLVAPSNTNLGIILLLAPLAAVPLDTTLDSGVPTVLDQLDDHDAQCVYQAIRLARPGGLGQAVTHDVAQPPTVPLMVAMKSAADRDGVAAAYCDRFEQVLDYSVNRLAPGPAFAQDWEHQVIRLALTLQAETPDTLIARKCGPPTAEQASQNARDVLEAGWPDNDKSLEALEHFDRWLRADGHRRNPGTTADLVTAVLFAALRENHIVAPDLNTIRPHTPPVPTD